MQNKNSCSAEVHERADKGFGPLNENLWRTVMYGILTFVFILGVSTLASANNCTGTMGEVCACDSCSDCYDALNINNNAYTVKLNTSIINHTGTCIDNPGNFNNKIFDCQGNTIDGDGSGTDKGIYLSSKDNNVIRNCVVTDFYRGIYLRYSDNNNITGNTANSNYYGIYLSSYSEYNNLINNTANNNNRHGFYTTSTAASNTINFNIFCNNNQSGGDYYDISNIGSNSGDNNTCTTTNNYNNISAVSDCVNTCSLYYRKIEYLGQFDDDNKTETNPLMEKPIPSYLINNTQISVSVIGIKSTNLGYPEENISVQLNVWNSNLTIVLNSTTDINGVSQFVLYNLPYSSEGYWYTASGIYSTGNISTNTRKININNTASFTYSPYKVNWLNYSCGNLTQILNNDSHEVIYLDEFPFSISAESDLSEIKNAQLLLVSNETIIRINGTINIDSNRIIFDNFSITNNNYTATVILKSSSETTNSIPKEIVVTVINNSGINSDLNLDLNGNYTVGKEIILPHNSTHYLKRKATFSKISKDADPLKIVRLEDIEENDSQTRFTYSILANYSDNHTIILTAYAENGSIICNDTRQVNISQNETYYLDFDVPKYIDNSSVNLKSVNIVVYSNKTESEYVIDVLDSIHDLTGADAIVIIPATGGTASFNCVVSAGVDVQGGLLINLKTHDVSIITTESAELGAGLILSVGLTDIAQLAGPAEATGGVSSLIDLFSDISIQGEATLVWGIEGNSEYGGTCTGGFAQGSTPTPAGAISGGLEFVACRNDDGTLIKTLSLVGSSGAALGYKAGYTHINTQLWHTTNVESIFNGSDQEEITSKIQEYLDSALGIETTPGKIFSKILNLTHTEYSELNNIAETQHNNIVNKIYNEHLARSDTILGRTDVLDENGIRITEIKYIENETGYGVMLKIVTKGRLSGRTYTTPSGRTYLEDYPNTQVAHTSTRKYIENPDTGVYEYKGMATAGRTVDGNYFEPRTGNAPATDVRKIESDAPAGSGNGVSAHISEI